MKPRSKVCFIGQLISQEKHFHLSTYDWDLDFFREGTGDLVEIAVNYIKTVKDNSCPNFWKCLNVTLCLKGLAF